MVKVLERYVNLKEIGSPRFMVAIFIPLIVLVNYGVERSIIYVVFVSFVSFIIAFACIRIVRSKKQAPNYRDERPLGKIFFYAIFGIYIFVNLLGWYQLLDSYAVSNISPLVFSVHIIYLTFHFLFTFTLAYGMFTGKLDLPVSNKTMLK